MNNNKSKKRKINIIITSILFVMLLLVSFTYAYFSANNQTTENSVKAGTLLITYEDDNLNTLTINNISPIYDSEIMTKANKIGFKVNNTGTSKAYVEITLTDIVIDNALLSTDFKWSLYSEDVSISSGDFSNIIVINIELLEGDITINVNLAQVPPTLQQGGGSNISGVALQVSASGTNTSLAAVGEARITGYTQTDGLTTIHVSAMASMGFCFVGWQIDGETISTLLSADIPYSDVEGKILVAVFAPIDNSTQNSTTDNNQTTDIV